MILKRSWTFLPFLDASSIASNRLLSLASSIPLASFSGLDGKGNGRPSPFSPVAFIPIAGHLYHRDRVEWLPPALDHYSQTLGTMTTPHPYRSVGCPLLTWFSQFIAVCSSVKTSR